MHLSNMKCVIQRSGDRHNQIARLLQFSPKDQRRIFLHRKSSGRQRDAKLDVGAMQLFQYQAASLLPPVSS